MMKRDNYDVRYRRVFARNSADFNLCFFCGCEATETDYCPPKHFAQSVLEFGEYSDWVASPACYECYALLHNERRLTLSTRLDALKTKLANKYQKALHVFRVWSEEELAEMSREFAHSIAGGMRLGREAAERLAYPGFAYECEGSAVIEQAISRTFSVKGQTFTSFERALDYCINEYALERGPFYNHLTDKCEGDFDKALAYFADQQGSLFSRRERVELRQFSKLHGQNIGFVERSCATLMKRDPMLNISDALEKLRVEYLR